MIVELMRLVHELKADATLDTPAKRRAEIKALYDEAKPIADKFGEIGKTPAELADAETRAADSRLWSDEVNAILSPGDKNVIQAIGDAHASCPDAARKGRWTVDQVRALFGVA